MARYLVTGASGGMGSAVCRRLYEAGHEVLGVDLKDPNEETPWRFIKADVTDGKQVEEAVSGLGPLDGVISAAGLYRLDSLVEMDEDGFIKIFNVNLFGVYRVNKAAVPHLKKGGRIVIITSELAPLSPLPFTGVYAVTKAALDRYADALRMELQLLEISVSVVRPGAVKTGMLPDSMKALDAFCDKTKLYPVNAGRFKKIVESVEAKSVAPEKVAATVKKALTASRPRLVYNVNRNPLLRLLNALPKRLQLFIIRKAFS